MEIGFTKDFQIQLLAHLVRDEKFFRATRGYIRLNDFDLPVCQFVYEAVRAYWDDLQQLPDQHIFIQHLLNCRSSTKMMTRLTAEEDEALAAVVAAILNIPALNTTYYQKQLPAYLRTIRVNQHVLASQGKLSVGAGAEELIQNIVKLNEQTITSGGIVFDSITANPEFVVEGKTNIRVPTGLRKLNNFTNNGLGRGEIGMVTACPGVGKTTTLINFMAAAVAAGIRCLFFTLELSGKRIKHRYLSIAGGVHNNVLKLPETKWPPHVAKAIGRITAKSYPFHDYTTIIDFSKRRYTLQDIDHVIAEWRQNFKLQYGDDDKAKCYAVFIDWLDRIDPSGMGYSKDKEDDKILTKLCERLSDMARNYEVALWTATQGNREADGKEVLGMRHTAGAYHKNDPLDIALALGVINNGTEQVIQAVYDPIYGMPLSRNIKVNITKNRDNPVVNFDIYQDSTLKFWNSMEDAKIAAHMVSQGDFAKWDPYIAGLGTSS